MAPAGAASTFTQIKRRDQLVACAIDAIVEVGFARASVAEVARRAGVSKGVVTYHFAAKDDLIRAVITDVLASMTDYLEPRLLATDPVGHPERFVASYITEWIGCYRALSRQLLALVGIYNNFRDESGLPSQEFDARARDIEIVTQVLGHGQANGSLLGSFDPRVVATVMKAALDDLLTQYAANPDLDLEAYGAHLVALFERATQPATDIKE
jgi:TetR/AcrR family transcriptional regulator, fatty acid metabolism regulator protein